jgi:hypothetical protein
LVGGGEDPLPSMKNNGATTETAAKEGPGKEENVAGRRKPRHGVGYA